MWPATREGQICGKHPETVMAFANRYAADGGNQARSWPAAQGCAFAGRIHGFFQVIKSFVNWCAREEYPVDPSALRMRPPKVALKEMSIYTPEQVKTIFEAAKVGWPQLAVKILLGTGIRVGELCNLQLED